MRAVKRVCVLVAAVPASGVVGELLVVEGSVTVVVIRSPRLSCVSGCPSCPDRPRSTPNAAVNGVGDSEVDDDVVVGAISVIQFTQQCTTTTPVYPPLFQDNLGKPVPER